MSKLKEVTNLKAFVVLACVIWVAHSYYILDLGFFEDDLAIFSKWLNIGFSGVAKEFEWGLLMPIQGRFLAGIASFLVAITGSFFGIFGFFALLFIIILLNGYLFYLILKKLGFPALFALIGALIFSLYPADNLHPWALSVGMRIINLILLIAILLYLKNYKKISYLLVFLTIGMYEPPIFLFFAVPLLAERWNKKIIKKLAINTAILSSMILFTYLTRVLIYGRVLGGRAESLSATALPFKVITAMTIGPIRALKQFFYGPAFMLYNINSAVIYVIGISFILLTFIFLWINSEFKVAEKTPSSVDAGGPEDGAASRTFYIKYSKLFIVGIILMVLSFVMGFFWEFYWVFSFTGLITGRVSRTFMLSSIGASIMITTVLWIIMYKIRVDRYKRVALFVLIAIFISTIFGYKFFIQQDYKEGWKIQQRLWTDIVELAPDMTENTLIFVMREEMPKATFIKAHSPFANPLTFAYIYTFPENWKMPPRMNYKSWNWVNKEVRVAGDKLEVLIKFPGTGEHRPERWETLPEENVIIIAWRGKRYERVYGAIYIKGKPFRLKPLSLEPVDQTFPRGVLYDYLIIDK